jgi:hypothetical protein
MRAGVQNFPAATSSVEFGVQWIAFNSRIDPITRTKGNLMNSIVWLVGAIVIVLFVLSFLGLR